MANGSVTRITVGSTDWSMGVNSNKSPTQASQENPNGVPLNQLCWGNNISVRGGGISPRKGWIRLASFQPGIGLHQESKLYTPDGQFPQIISQIGGRTFRVRVDTDNSIDEITIPGDPNPADRDQAWMAQGEQFMVIQDGLSLPLIWDGVVMRRSAGNPQVLGVVGVAGVAPAVGSSVLLTLTAPFAGTTGQTVVLNGNTYSVTSAGNFITMRNDASGGVGGTVPTGTTVDPTGQPQMLTAAPFVVPPIGSSVTVAVNNAYAGPVPNTAGINGAPAWWTITAVGLPPPGVNQVYLTNLTDVPAAAIAVNATISSIGEIPTAEPMVYYMGRLWLALGREYLAGDIVRGPSGSAQYEYRDSILKMTENTYLALGGTFIVPTNAGNIRALAFPANLNTALGEGQLLVFTREQIYSVNVVPTRAAWATLSEPIQRVAQINFGTTSDRSIVGVNGDLFFQSPDGIRSFIQAIRDFDQWGDVAISVEEQRAIEANDRSLLRFGSGIDFNNRLLQTCLPYLTDVGVAHRGLMPLNFDLISTLASSLPPAFEGLNEGLEILRVLKGDFGGRQRAFALVREGTADGPGNIAVWELTDYAPEDTNASGDARISWRFETCSYTWSKPFELKELDTIEIWLDRLYGNVEFAVEFRPDQWPCFEPWTKWIECAPRNNCEDCGVLLPCEYPEQIYPMQYRATIVLPKPPTRCATSQSRPLHLGYSFQFRISIKGHCRIRGLMVHAFPKDKAPYLSVTAPCSSAGC